MGRDLGQAFPAARAVFREVDEALGFGLSTVMWNGPEELLTRTDHAQPAILAHTLAVWALVAPAVDPVAVAAGHSLGEYSAYVVAGALSLGEGARLVRRRGELMHAAERERPGTMAAVVGMESERVIEACAVASADCGTAGGPSGGGGVVVAANFNAPDQTVISGDLEAVRRASELLRAWGAKRLIPLKVSGAFHSPLMAAAADSLRQALARAPIAPPAFPVVANASASPVRSAAEAREQLARQLVSPVRWVESSRAVVAEAGDGARLVEIGPGNVLGALLRRTVPGAAVTSLGTAEDVRTFLERS